MDNKRVGGWEDKGGSIGCAESKTLQSQRLYARVGEREDKGGV
jgi:hypothetical protein